MNPKRNVIIFHQAALGDFVVTWPIALGLMRAMAQHRVMYVTSSNHGKLAEQAIGVEWRDADRFTGLFSNDAALDEKSGRAIEQAAIIISFVTDGKDAWADRVRKISPDAKLIPMIARPPDDWPTHITDWHLGQLANEPMSHSAATQMLRHLQTRGLITPPSKGFTLIHPGSGGKHKLWPIEKFIELASKLKSSSETVRFLLGDVELESWKKSDIDSLRNVTELITPKSLNELFDTLKRATLFIGNDSGPSHLAGIIGLPTIALFGASNERIWKPIGPRAVIVKKEPIESLSIDEVIAQIGVAKAQATS
ncbi:MAG TPA: glycosyltransferase family 9 protein [Tepidisphaeraceae bacterium]|nr:glycosyltransferase family 9 protein [Tepidisphaeraceae bacterium]